jgi:biopolymer transport protein ExbB
MHVIEQLKHGLLAVHATWVLWLLVALGLIALTIGAERWLFLRSVSTRLESLLTELERLMRAGQLAEATTWLSKSRSAVAAVGVAGLQHADLGVEGAQRAMDAARGLQRVRLERGLAFLGTLGNNAPFLGLLGTVIGIIEAFEALGRTRLGSAGPGGVLAPAAVMSGIAEALVATAVGLIVALPTVALYNFLHRRIQTLLVETEALGGLVLAHLAAKPTPPGSR